MNANRLLLAGLVVLICLGPLRADSPQQRSAAETMDIVMWGREPIGGPFALIDHSGQERRDTDYRGKLMLIYFGFTYCPDICPTDLLNMSLAIDQLGEDGNHVQPLFVSVDPERDTAPHLAQYVSLFHPRLVGLTGRLDAIRSAANAYKVYFAKVSTGSGEYTVDHSAFIYLMGESGQYLGFFPPSTTPERIAQTIRKELLAGRR